MGALTLYTTWGHSILFIKWGHSILFIKWGHRHLHFALIMGWPWNDAHILRSRNLLASPWPVVEKPRILISRIMWNAGQQILQQRRTHLRSPGRPGALDLCTSASLLSWGAQPLYDKGTRPLKPAGSRAVCGKMTVSATPNRFSYYVTFTIHTRCTIYAAGRIIQPGGPRVGDPRSIQLHRPGFYSVTSSRKLGTKHSIKGQPTSQRPNEGTSALKINHSINLLPSARQRYPLD